MVVAFYTSSTASDPELALVSLRQPIESTPEAVDLDSYSQEERRLNLFISPSVWRLWLQHSLLNFLSY
jgi:hypothetical protein